MDLSSVEQTYTIIHQDDYVELCDDLICDQVEVEEELDVVCIACSCSELINWEESLEFSLVLEDEDISTHMKIPLHYDTFTE